MRDQLEVQDGILKYKWLNVIHDAVQSLPVAPFELRKVIFQKLRWLIQCDNAFIENLLPEEENHLFNNPGRLILCLVKLDLLIYMSLTYSCFKVPRF